MSAPSSPASPVPPPPSHPSSRKRHGDDCKDGGADTTATKKPKTEDRSGGDDDDDKKHGSDDDYTHGNENHRCDNRMGRTEYGILSFYPDCEDCTAILQVKLGQRCKTPLTGHHKMAPFHSKPASPLFKDLPTLCDDCMLFLAQFAAAHVAARRDSTATPLGHYRRNGKIVNALHEELCFDFSKPVESLKMIRMHNVGCCDEWENHWYYESLLASIQCLDDIVVLLCEASKGHLQNIVKVQQSFGCTKAACVSLLQAFAHPLVANMIATTTAVRFPRQFDDDDTADCDPDDLCYTDVIGYDHVQQKKNEKKNKLVFWESTSDMTARLVVYSPAPEAESDQE